MKIKDVLKIAGKIMAMMPAPVDPNGMACLLCDVEGSRDYASSYLCIECFERRLNNDDAIVSLIQFTVRHMDPNDLEDLRPTVNELYRGMFKS